MVCFLIISFPLCHKKLDMNNSFSQWMTYEKPMDTINISFTINCCEDWDSYKNDDK